MSESSPSTKWYTRLTKSHGIAVLVFIALAVLTESPFGYQADNLIARRIEFKVRRWLQMEPTLDPRIKILSFGIKALELVGTDNLELSAWGKLLTDISALKPKLVIIDKRFGLKGNQDPKNSFATLNTPTTPRLVTGGYVESGELQQLPRDVVVLDGDDYSLPQLLKRSGFDESAIPHLDWLPMSQGRLIGPDKSLGPVLKYSGHFQVEEFGFIRPLIRLEEKWVVPHFSLLTADKFGITPKNLLVNDKIVHLDSQDLIIPNVISAATMNLRTVSLRTFIYLSSKNTPLTIKPLRKVTLS